MARARRTLLTLPAKLSSQSSEVVGLVRYWIHGEDEDYERELERARRLQESLPAPVSRAAVAGAAVLVIAEVLLFLAFAAGLALTLR